MKKRNIIMVIAFLCILVTPLQAKKGAATATVKDSEYDTIGNTCRADGKCTYTHRETLAGGIPAEVQIVSLGAFKGDVDQVFEYAFNDVRRVAGLFDENDPQSEISRVNAGAGVGFVQVGPEFIQLINAAKKVYLWTDGTFDITATPDIGNFSHIKIKGNMVYLKKANMKISFKNIASGYIADLLIRAVYNANIDNMLAEVGNTSRSIGTSVAGNWRTTVTDAEGRYAKRGMTLDISNVSVGTVTKGKNAPDVDPRWGTPVIPYCRSVTIISRNAAIAEALAYGIYVLGPEKGMALINRLQTIRGVIVDSNGNFIKSPGI